mmetsp:Transcript_42217/g.106329  ORF Transcript_42217/g.106329 Transcript_42217/m.106329 type:complete len:149 (+) Transcript_42217:329-775(+)
MDTYARGTVHWSDLMAVGMKDNLRTTRRTEMASFHMQAETFTMGSGSKITPKGTGGSHTGMGQAMKVNGTKIVSRGMVLNNGLTDRNSKGIICAARNMARVHSIGLIARCTKANSTKTKSMVMANTDGQMAALMLVNGIIVDSMALAI